MSDQTIVIIWVMKTFFVQFFCVFLPSLLNIFCFCSVQFSRSVMSDSLWPHDVAQQASCPSPTPGVHSESSPSSQWCHPAIASWVVPFFYCPQTLLVSESFPFCGFPLFLCIDHWGRQRNQRSNCQHLLDHWKTVPEKHLFLLYWLCQSLWLCGSQ